MIAILRDMLPTRQGQTFVAQAFEKAKNAKPISPIREVPMDADTSRIRIYEGPLAEQFVKVEPPTIRTDIDVLDEPSMVGKEIPTPKTARVLKAEQQAQKHALISLVAKIQAKVNELGGSLKIDESTLITAKKGSPIVQIRANGHAFQIPVDTVDKKNWQILGGLDATARQIASRPARELAQPEAQLKFAPEPQQKLIEHTRTSSIAYIPSGIEVYRDGVAKELRQFNVTV